jgi:hypothetical protein
MNKKAFFCFFLFFSLFSCLYAQDHEPGNYPDMLRGEVFIELEPIYAGFVDKEYPLDITTASRRALEETAMLYSAMIYGWSFHYDIGERARKINQNLELKAAGEIPFGDPGLQVTEVEIRDMKLRIWTNYNLSDAQQRRLKVWRSGTIRNAQAIGYGPDSIEEYPGWLALKKSALEDAARIALRKMLQGSERNRPKEVTGFISLASFPRFFIDEGHWAVSARFRVQIIGIIPFAAY